MRPPLFVVVGTLSFAVAAIGVASAAGPDQSVVATAEASGEGVPTFTKDVAPILFNNCSSCHRPGNIAPMSLLSYTDARPWSRAIKEKVVSREMPPWHAAPGGRAIRNWRGLTEEQIATLVAWVDAGAPKGDEADLPPLPTFSDTWNHPTGREPDLVIEMPVEYELAAEGEIPYMFFYQPVPFSQDRFAQALEMLPGSRNVVHHMSAHIVSLPEGSTIVDGIAVGPDGQALSRSDVRKASQAVFDNVLGGSTKLISFVPGRGFEMHRAGVAKRLPAGKYIQWNIHYQPTGRPEKDRSKIGLWFGNEPVRHEMLSRIIGGPLPTDPDAQRQYIVEGRTLEGRERIPNIPPHAANWEIVSITDITEPITFYAMSPHMHLRGKAMKFVVEWPDGRQETILDVPQYDFNWQTEFELVEPMRIPAGSRLLCYGVFDNSINNRYNPAPEKEVYWAEQSWDEMFEGWVKYTIDSQDLTKRKSTNKQQEHP